MPARPRQQAQPLAPPRRRRSAPAPAGATKATPSGGVEFWRSASGATSKLVAVLLPWCCRTAVLRWTDCTSLILASSLLRAARQLASRRLAARSTLPPPRHGRRRRRRAWRVVALRAAAGVARRFGACLRVRAADAFGATGQSAAPFFVMAGPNVVESREHALKMARQLKLVSDSLGLQLVFKASFDKANRTSAGAFRGPGLEDGLRVLDEVRTSTGLNIVTDIHEPWQAEPVACVLVCCTCLPPALRRRARQPRCPSAADPCIPLPPNRPAASSRCHTPRGALEEGPVVRAGSRCVRVIRYGYHDGIAARLRLLTRYPSASLCCRREAARCRRCGRRALRPRHAVRVHRPRDGRAQHRGNAASCAGRPGRRSCWATAERAHQRRCDARAAAPVRPGWRRRPRVLWRLAVACARGCACMRCGGC